MNRGTRGRGGLRKEKLRLRRRRRWLKRRSTYIKTPTQYELELFDR